MRSKESSRVYRTYFTPAACRARRYLRDSDELTNITGIFHINLCKKCHDHSAIAAEEYLGNDIDQAVYRLLELGLTLAECTLENHLDNANEVSLTSYAALFGRAALVARLELSVWVAAEHLTYLKEEDMETLILNLGKRLCAFAGAERFSYAPLIAAAASSPASRQRLYDRNVASDSDMS